MKCQVTTRSVMTDMPGTINRLSLYGMTLLHMNATTSYLHFSCFARDAISCSNFNSFLLSLSVFFFFHKNRITSTSDLNWILNCVFLPDFFQTNRKLNFAKMSVMTLLHSLDYLCFPGWMVISAGNLKFVSILLKSMRLFYKVMKHF